MKFARLRTFAGRKPQEATDNKMRSKKKSPRRFQPLQSTKRWESSRLGEVEVIVGVDKKPLLWYNQNRGCERWCDYVVRIIASISINIRSYVIKKQCIFHSSIWAPPFITTLASRFHSRGLFVNQGSPKTFCIALGIEEWNALGGRFE